AFLCGTMRDKVFLDNIRFPLVNTDVERMPAEGIEPTRSCDHWILSPARLPVPPRRREGIKLQKRSRSSSISRRVRTQRASLPLARASLLAGEYVFSVG